MKELKSAVFDLKEDKASEIGADVNTLIDDINKSVETIEKFEGKKVKLKENLNSGTNRDKLMKKVKVQFKDTVAMINTSRATLNSKRKMLAETT